MQCIRVHLTVFVSDCPTNALRTCLLSLCHISEMCQGKHIPVSAPAELTLQQDVP